MEDFEYLKNATGDSGVLSSLSLDSINNNLTTFFDQIYGPDEVDSCDASCNTCKHFVRKGMNPQERSERNIYGMPGRCAVKEIEVFGQRRGIYCGFENADCYENRRTGMRPKDACISKEPREGR